MRRAVAVFALAGAPAVLGAQVFAGRVVEQPDPGQARRPLAGMPVRLLRAAPGDTAAPVDTTPVAAGQTAADGVFTLLAPTPGTYRVRVGAASYGPVDAVTSPDSTVEREYLVAVDYSTVFQVAEVDSEAVLNPASWSGRLRYPIGRLPGNPYGAAMLQMVVDTAGRVEPNTLAVASATQLVFGEFAIDALKQATFRPARRGGRHVRQLVPVLAEFSYGEGPPPNVLPPKTVRNFIGVRGHSVVRVERIGGTSPGDPWDPKRVP